MLRLIQRKIICRISCQYITFILYFIFINMPVGNIWILILESIITFLIISVIIVLTTFFTDEFKEVKKKILILKGR